MDKSNNHEHNMDDWEVNEISKEPSIDRLQVTLKIRPDQLSLKRFGSEKLDRNCNINYILEGEDLNDSDEGNYDIDDDLSQYAEQVIQDTSRLILDDSFGNPELSSTRNEDLLPFDSDSKTERSNTPDSSAAFTPSRDAANSSRLSTLTIEEGNEVEMFSVKPLSEAEVKRKLIQTFDHGGRHSRNSAASENVGELDLESLSSHPQLERLENVEVSIKEQLLKENVVKMSEVMKELEASYKKEIELLCLKHQEEMDGMRGRMNSSFEHPPVTPALLCRSNINFNNNNNNNNDGDNVSPCWSKTDVIEDRDHWQEICLLRESYDKELNSLLEKLELAKVQTEEKQVVINALEVKEVKLQSDLNSSMKEIERLKSLASPSPIVQLSDMSLPNKDCICCLEKDETIASQNKIIEQLREAIGESRGDQNLENIVGLKDSLSQNVELEKLSALLEEKDSEIASLKNLIDELNLKLESHADPDYIRAYERYLSDIEEGDVEDGEELDQKFLCSAAEVVGNEDGDDDDNSSDVSADSSDRDDDGDDEDDDNDVEQGAEQELKDDVRAANLIDFNNPVDITNNAVKVGDDEDMKDQSGVRSGDAAVSDGAADEESDSEEPCLRSTRWEQLIGEHVEEAVSLVGTTSVDLSSDFNKKVDGDDDEDEDRDDDVDDDDDNNGKDDIASDHLLDYGVKIADQALDPGEEAQGDVHSSLIDEISPGKGSAKKLSHHYDESVDVDDDDDDDDDGDDDEEEEENGEERVENECSANASEMKDSCISDDDDDDDHDNGDDGENVDHQSDEPTEPPKTEAHPIDCGGYGPLDASYLLSDEGGDDDVGRDGADDDDDDEKADDHEENVVADKEVAPSEDLRYVDALHRLVEDCAVEVGLDLGQLKPEKLKYRIISFMNELKQKAETPIPKNKEEDDHDDYDCDGGESGADSAGRGKGVLDNDAARDPNTPEIRVSDRRESIIKEMQLEIVGLKEAVGREDQLRMTLEFMEEELKRVRCSFEERVVEEVERRLDELKESVDDEIEMRGNDKAVDVDDDDDHYGECADISDDEDVEHIQEIPLKMLKLSSQSQTRDLSHARGGAGEEVVKIRVKDLKAIKSRLKSAESFNEHYHSTVCDVGKIIHGTEMKFLEFFKNFGPCVSSRAIRTTEELENRSSNNNINNNERHAEFGGGQTPLEELGGIEQMIDPTKTDVRRYSLADLEKDYTSDQSDCALVLEGSSRIEMAVRHLLRAIQVYEDKNKELEDVGNKLVEEKKILHLETNRLHSELLEATDRNHRLDLDLNLAQSVIGGYQREREELDAKLKEHEDEIVRLSLRVQELEDGLREHASAKEELRLKEEHVRRQSEQLQHSAIEEGIQGKSAEELLRENNQLNEECADLRDRLRRDKERFESQLTELDASNCQLQARIEALQKENVEAANDNKLRVEALEKQLTVNKKYIENQSIEREQEIDRHQEKVKELDSVLVEKEQVVRKNQKLKSEMQELEEQLSKKLNACMSLDEEVTRLKQLLKGRNEEVARLAASNKLLEANLNNFYEKEAASTKDSSEMDSTMVSKDNEAELQAVQEMESLRMTLSKVEEALSLARNSEKNLEERNSQLEKEVAEHEKYVKELKRNYLMLERREEELNEELTSLKMDAEQRCLERHAMKYEVDDVKSNLSGLLKEEKEKNVKLGRENALLSLELEEISIRVALQAETINKMTKELETLRLEKDQFNNTIHSLENQNSENQIKILELSAKASQAQPIIKFDLAKEESDLMKGLEDDYEMLRAENSRLKEQLSAHIPNGNAFSLFSSLSHGSPEAVRKSTGSLPGKSFSLEESSVLNAPRKKLNSPSLASMNEDDKNNSYSSRRSSGGVRNDLAGRKVVFANDIQSSHHERVIESILSKFDIHDLEEVEELVEAKSSAVLELTTRLEREQQEKVAVHQSLTSLENKIKNIESESRELRGSLASREAKVQELRAQLEAVNTSHHDELCNLSRAMSEKDDNISSLASRLEELSQIEEKKSQQINQLKSKMASQEAAIKEMEALKSQHEQLLEKCTQLESRFRAVMAENRKLMHGDLEKNEVVEGLRRELNSARKISEDGERSVREEMKRLVEENEATKQKLQVAYGQLKNSEDREQLKLERLRLIHAKELQSLKIGHQEEIRKLEEEHNNALEVRSIVGRTSVKPEDVNITLAEFTTILPETSCDELSDDLQSILKKLHQEAMKVLTLSDFKYLEQLERQGAELERSRVEWNSEKQRMIEQQMGQIKSLEEKIVELQSSLTEERQNSQKFGKYLEEGEHKLKKLRTEREKIRAKLVAEREAFKALTRGFESQRDEMERELNLQREELSDSNAQKELLQRQHQEIKMKLHNIEEQLRRSKDAERNAGPSPAGKQIMSLELIEQTLKMITSLIKGRCIENALEALRCIQSDVHEILREYNEKSGGCNLTKEVLNGKMLEHNATLLNHIHQICNEKAELVEKMEQLRKEAGSQRNYKQLLESFDDERKRLLEENKTLSDNLVEAKKELRFASSDDRRKEQLVRGEVLLVQFIWELQKLYGKYLRAESFRKSLAYQKKYLLMVLEEFQESEQATLRAIARMTSHAHTRHSSGCDDSVCDEGSGILSGIRRDFQRSIKFSSGKDQKRHNNLGPLERFRSAARVVVAVSRLKFLVKKWRKTVQQGPRASNSEILPASLPSTSAFPSFTSISSLLDSQGADGSNVRISSMQGTFEERVLKSYANLSRHLQRASHTDVARDQNADGALGGLSRPTASATAILQTSPSERPSARDKKAIGFTPPSKLPSKIRSDERDLEDADSSNYRLPPPVTSKEYMELVKNLKKRLDDKKL